MQISHTENAERIEHNELDFVSSIQNQEILKTIDPHIKVSLRKYYLLLLYGQKIPKKYSTLLLQNIKEILQEHSYG